MSKKTRKNLLLSLKLILAAVLLVWVLSKAHWHDYVVAKEDFSGKSYAVLSENLPAKGDTELRVQSGMLWWKTSQVLPLEEFEPIGEAGQIVRKGVASSILTMDKLLFAIAVLGFPASLVMVGYRFWYLLKAQEIRISLWEAVRLTFLGQFFNMVIPGTVGGDLVKAWYVNKHTHKAAEVLMTIFIDRVIGLVEFVLMSGVMLLIVLGFGLDSFARLELSVITVAVAGAGCLGVLLFVLSPRVRKLFRLGRFYRKLPIAHHIAAMGKSSRLYREKPGVLGWALFITLICHLFFIGAIAAMGVAIGLDTPAWAYFIYLPLIYIIGAVPITPGGVGLVENLYLKFFTVAAVGVVSPQTSGIIALAMLARIVPMFWGLGGLWVVITGPKLPKADDMQAELDADEQREEARSG